jgi:hypothetical protein
MIKEFVFTAITVNDKTNNIIWSATIIHDYKNMQFDFNMN